MADQSLHKFVTTNILPARVKVTEGVYNTEQVDWEFSNGDVLDLHKIVCPSVQLAFVHPDTGEERTLSVSTQSSCLFKIMPYIPGRPIHLNKAMVIHGTTELVRIWPSVVCARSSYSDYDLAIVKGEKLRLKRLLHKDGMFLLECSRHNSQLVRLPLTCDLEYLLVDDTTSYTLAEIAEMQGRVERRIRQSDDNINKTHPIPGLPRDLTSDMIMAPPQRFVEIHPADSPGEQIVAPIDVDISVCDRDMDYIGMAFAWYPFQQFVDANSSKFPMIVAIADWEDESVTVQAIRASVGDRIVLHKMEEVLKASCQVGSSYFVIPLTYDAAFDVKPRIFGSIEDVCNHKVKKVKVIGDARSREPGLSGVCKGEILEILSSKRDGKTSGVVTVRKERTGIEKLPLNLSGQYQEILNIPPGRTTLNKLEPSMLPLTVVFHDPSASILPSKDGIPRDVDVLILFMFSDSCVRASKNIGRGFSSPIPTRTGISVRYISQYKSIPAPEMSALAICPEEITEERLLTLEIMYQNMDRFPDEAHQPTLKPRKGCGTAETTMTLDRLSGNLGSRAYGLNTSRDGVPLPPVPGQSAQFNKKHSSFGRAGLGPPPPIPVSVKRAHSLPLLPVPARSEKPQDDPRARPSPRPPDKYPRECVIEDEIDYEEVGDLKDYNPVMMEIFGEREPPSITTPADANISSFTWQEMIVFLQLTAMPPHSLRLFARDRVSGSDFAALDTNQLVAYGVNYPIMRHYKKKSKPPGLL